MYIDKIWNKATNVSKPYQMLMDKMFIQLIIFSSLLEGMCEEEALEANESYIQLKGLIKECAPMHNYEDVKKEITG